MLKKMFGLEYEYSDGSASYNLFETFDLAKEHFLDTSLWTEDCQPKYIFSAVFNSERIYLESYSDNTKLWNYDDCSDTIISDGDILYPQGIIK